MVISLAFILTFSVLVKIGWKSVSYTYNYLVSSGTLNLNSVNFHITHWPNYSQLSLLKWASVWLYDPRCGWLNYSAFTTLNTYLINLKKSCRWSNIRAVFKVFSTRCNIYISCLCYDVNVRLSLSDGSAMSCGACWEHSGSASQRSWNHHTIPNKHDRRQWMGHLALC